MAVVTIGYICFTILAIIAFVGVVVMFIIDAWWGFDTTYTYPWTAPMGSQSDGSNMIFWVTFLLTVTRFSAVCNCIARSANSRSSFVRYLLVVVLLVAIGSEIAGVAVLFVEQSGCNAPPTGDPGTTSRKFCNDFRWCCVYGTIGAPPANTTPVNLACPILLAPCVPAVAAADLGWNWVFKTNFGMVWIMGLLWVLLLACSVWMRTGLKRKILTEGTYENSDGSSGIGGPYVEIDVDFHSSSFGIEDDDYDGVSVVAQGGVSNRSNGGTYKRPKFMPAK